MLQVSEASERTTHSLQAGRGEVGLLGAAEVLGWHVALIPTEAGRKLDSLIASYTLPSRMPVGDL